MNNNAVDKMNINSKNIIYPTEYEYFYQHSAPFLIQKTTYSNGTTILIEARTSIYLQLYPLSNNRHTSIYNAIATLVHSIYSGIILFSIKRTTNLYDKDLQDFLNSLDPKISIPVKLLSSRYFVNPNNHIIQLNNFAGDWIFFDILTTVPPGNPGNNFKLSDLQGGNYEEKDYDTIHQIIQQRPVITPSFTPPTILNGKDFAKYYTSALSVTSIYNPHDFYLTKSPANEYNGFGGNQILNIINSYFAKHISFSVFQPIIDTIPFTKNTSNTFEAESILNSIDESDEVFVIANFIRSYIDLYHDILTKGSVYCEEFRRIFESTFPTLVSHPFYKKYFREEYAFKTQSGNINQVKCSSVIESVADDLIEYLHNKDIKYIPLTKEASIVMSASIENPDEMNKLFNTLKGDGVKGFYVESANNGIGSMLVYAGFKLVDLTVGQWDAGSGFTGKNKIEKILIGQGQQIDIPNEPITLFNSVKINVSADNKTLSCSLPNRFDETITIKGPVKLSVNSILTTIGEGIVRGSADKTINRIATIPLLEHTNKATRQTFKQSIVSLKTWTDLIQIITLSRVLSYKNANKDSLKILTVVSDGLCETTARMYGLGHVLKTEGKIVTYYNYNINSRVLTNIQKEIRTKLKTFIKNDVIKKHTSNKKFSYIRDYLHKWFEQRIIILQNINDTIYDPILYFVSRLFIGKYKDACIKCNDMLNAIDNINIRLIPDTLDEFISNVSNSATLLGEFMEYITQFNSIINSIVEFNSREKGRFLDIYMSVQQLIINTFGDSSERELRTLIATTFAYVFVKNTRGVDHFIFTMNSIKEGLKISNDSDLKTQRNINDIIEACHTLLYKLPEFGVNTDDTTPITYSYFIKEAPSRPILEKIPDAFAFKNVIRVVNSVIPEYYGGKSKKAPRKTLRYKKQYFRMKYTKKK